MSIMPSPDALIKSVLGNGSNNVMSVYNLERKSSLKTPQKDEIIIRAESEIESTEKDRSNEESDSGAVREILDIFPGATVTK